ncbi:MAG TPA: pyridoxal phosphate-dependent aminotransferase [Acidimicrobiales bacterium]
MLTGRRPYLTERLQGFGASIFGEMSLIAARTGAINLGQGFPDTDGPAEVIEAAIAAMRDGHNQYPPPFGIPALRNAIAQHQQRFYGLTYDPDTEVLVTAGATEAIAATIIALCDRGDEVVAFEPYYDSYAACIAMAGARRVPITLRAPDFALDVDRLREAITPRTRLLLLNTPHNPTGKVFSREELSEIAQVCIENDVIVMTDEVYEHLTYDCEHVPMAAIPGMRDRTITVSSAGKTFSFTGWKIGWLCASAPLVAAVHTVKQFLTYVNGAPFQHAVAIALALGDDFYDGFRRDLQAKRDLLVDGLTAAGFRVFPPDGTYFVTTDVRPFGETDGMAFCRALPERAGVVAIPAVVLYDDVEEGGPLVRFAFCKRTEVLQQAVERLAVLA